MHPNHTALSFLFLVLGVLLSGASISVIQLLQSHAMVVPVIVIPPIAVLGF
jgi:hypothetical protein